MTFEELVQKLSPDLYRRLRTALELGKWPDGGCLTQAQKALCMEAVIYYENHHRVPEALRVGYIDRRRTPVPARENPEPVRFVGRLPGNEMH